MSIWNWHCPSLFCKSSIISLASFLPVMLVPKAIIISVATGPSATAIYNAIKRKAF